MAYQLKREALTQDEATRLANTSALILKNLSCGHFSTQAATAGPESAPRRADRSSGASGLAAGSRWHPPARLRSRVLRARLRTRGCNHWLPPHDDAATELRVTRPDLVFVLVL